MTHDEMIEAVARALCCARARCEGCKGSGEGGCFDLDLWDQEAKAAIAAMQPHIAAEREDAARRALEAAVVEVYSECNVAEMIAPIIRAINPAQFREAGNGA